MLSLLASEIKSDLYSQPLTWRHWAPWHGMGTMPPHPVGCPLLPGSPLFSPKCTAFVVLVMLPSLVQPEVEALHLFSKGWALVGEATPAWGLQIPERSVCALQASGLVTETDTEDDGVLHSFINSGRNQGNGVLKTWWSQCEGSDVLAPTVGFEGRLGLRLRCGSRQGLEV